MASKKVADVYRTQTQKIGEVHKREAKVWPAVLGVIGVIVFIALIAGGGGN